MENKKKILQTEEYRLNQSIAAKKVIHTEEWNKKVGNHNTIRFHLKKIRYFLENGMNIKTISNYFNITEDKINESLKIHKGFDTEPNINILLEAYNLYESGLKINTIHRKMADAPAKLQMKIFIELKGL